MNEIRFIYLGIGVAYGLLTTLNICYNNAIQVEIYLEINIITIVFTLSEMILYLKSYYEVAATNDFIHDFEYLKRIASITKSNEIFELYKQYEKIILDGDRFEDYILERREDFEKKARIARTANRFLCILAPILYIGISIIIDSNVEGINNTLTLISFTLFFISMYVKSKVTEDKQRYKHMSEKLEDKLRKN